MKAFEHISKEAHENWEKCFYENSRINEINTILDNRELLNTLLMYENYGNFHNHAHNSFKCEEDSYPKNWSETYEGIDLASIKSFYDWLEDKI